MGGRNIIGSAISVAILAMAAQIAHAEPAKPNQATFTTRDAFAPDLNQWAPQAGRRTLEWDSKKAKWGLKLDLDQQVGRPLSYAERDVQAGAYYKITPSFRVGGAVSLGQMNYDQHPSAVPADHAPKVRLETAFKF